MSAHTPGPWRTEEGHDGFGHWHWSIGASYQWPEGEAAFVALAFTPPLGVGPYAANRTADAHLIAAAPELEDGCNALIGLIQIVCLRDDMPPDIKKALLCSHRMDEALAALAKAEGR